VFLCANSNDAYPYFTRSKRLELELSYGHISFDLLMYYFKKGEKYYHVVSGDKVSCDTLQGVVLTNFCELAGLCTRLHEQRRRLFFWASMFPPLFVFILS
jgi:hypothetical protein